MLVPSSAVESMGMGGMLGAAAMHQARMGTESSDPFGPFGSFREALRSLPAGARSA